LVASIVGSGSGSSTPARATGLRGASSGLQVLFSQGSLRGSSILDIRSTLTRQGFKQTLTRNKEGYLFQNAAGEQVRIMHRGGSWDIRVRNRYGNYLDEFGNVADASLTHGIEVFSK
jgi:hypothetical protein